jgi:hypothetical protein
MAFKGKHLNSMAQDEHDGIEYRKRVSMVLDGDILSYEQTSFASLPTTIVLDVYSSLASLRPGSEQYIGHNGFISNDGPGSMAYEFSADGINYGGYHVLYGGEQLNFENLKINKLRLTRIDDAAFRILIG